MAKDVIGYLKASIDNKRPDSAPKAKRPIPIWYQAPRDNNKYNADGTHSANYKLGIKTE